MGMFSNRSFCFLLFILVSLSPFLSIFAYNASILDAKMVLTIIPFFLANIVLLYILSIILERFINRETSISLAILSLYIFYFFSDIRDLILLIHQYLPIFAPKIISLFLIVFIYVLFFTLKSRLSVLFFTFFTLAYTVSSLVLLIPLLLYSSKKTDIIPVQVQKNKNEPYDNITFKHKPNVYIITVDGYGRKDMLKRHLNFDNELIPYLEENGYTVIENSHSNYPITFLSLSSTFTGSYLFKEGQQFFSRAPLYKIIGGTNPVVNVFQENGYLLVHGEGGAHDVANCSNPNSICIKKSIFNVGSFFYRTIEKTLSPELLGVILNKTPLFIINNIFVNHYVVTIDQLIQNISVIKQKNINNQPIYMYAYTLPPHPPLIFNPDCSLKHVFKDSKNLGGSQDKKGYLDNLKCTNKTIKNFVEYIKETDPSAIVVFFSDHGTDFSVDWLKDPAMWSKETVEERMSNFIAIKLPESSKNSLPKKMSNINIFPYIFRYLSGTQIPLHEDRFFVTIYENTPFEGKFIEKHLQ